MMTCFAKTLPMCIKFLLCILKDIVHTWNRKIVSCLVQVWAHSYDAQVCIDCSETVMEVQI